MPAWLGAFARATIFHCNLQCNRLSCQSNSPPLEMVQDSNPINPPPQFISIFMRSANKILCMIFLLLPPSPSLPLPHFLAYYPSKESVEMASALVGSENVQCTIVAMEQADRQAALPPSLACLPDSPALDSFMCSLFWGFRTLSTRHRVK